LALAGKCSSVYLRTGFGGTSCIDTPLYSAGIPGSDCRVTSTRSSGRGTPVSNSRRSTRLCGSAATRLCGSRTPAKESSSPTKRAAG